MPLTNPTAEFMPSLTPYRKSRPASIAFCLTLLAKSDTFCLALLSQLAMLPGRFANHSCMALMPLGTVTVKNSTTLPQTSVALALMASQHPLMKFLKSSFVA